MITIRAGMEIASVNQVNLFAIHSLFPGCLCVWTRGKTMQIHIFCVWIDYVCTKCTLTKHILNDSLFQSVPAVGGIAYFMLISRSTDALPTGIELSVRSSTKQFDLFFLMLILFSLGVYRDEARAIWHYTTMSERYAHTHTQTLSLAA